MYCVRKVVDDLYWVGGNDHRLALFENIHPIPRGVSYNSYLLLDEKTVLFDTVDWSICRQFLENVEHVLDGRDLDYLVINHMEPDHGASIEEILLRYPNVTIISTEKSIMLMHQFGFDVDMVEVSKICQFSENKFNGVNCGIMDQFAIAMGKAGHAIFLDTADLSYTYAPLELTGAKIVIACSNKKRGLADSKYNERRSQCETALAQLQAVKPINSLGELTEEEFDAIADTITDPVNRKRAKHAVYENQRTIRAVEALKNNDIALFGKLMNESHVSLRDDYEVTGIELDTLAETAWKQPGVIGSRMTGAGFGGCTVSIVEDDKIDAFIENVGNVYKDKIGYAADFYVVTVGDGAHKM